MRHPTGLSVVAVAVTFLVLTSAVARALPATVFVYNHLPGKRSDGLEANAFAFILKELGLLDAYGKPDIPESSKIRDGQGNVIGYKSADGTKEAYNVSAGATTDDAWKRVAPGGLLHIIKHGASQKNASGVLELGGGIRLDGGAVFDGFTDKNNPGSGTGAGFQGAGGVPSGPYGLTPRPPGDNITINANACWSAKDPDGNGPKSPVTTSGGGVPGVGTATGEQDSMSVQVKYWLSGGTAQEKIDAHNRLLAAARAAGYPPQPTDGSPRPETTYDDAVDFISDLDPDTRYDRLQEIVDNGNPPKVRINLQYRKVNQARSSEEFGGHNQNPRQIPPGGGGYDYQYHDGDPNQFTAAFLVVPNGAISWPAILNVTQQGELMGPPPPGLELASGAFMFEILNGNPIAAPLHISFATFGEPSSVQVRRYDPNLTQWVAPVGSIVWNGRVATVSTIQMGLYAAFQPSVSIPALSRWGIALLILLLAASAVLLIRRNARLRSQRQS